MSGVEARGALTTRGAFDTKAAAALAWTGPERLAVAALLAILLSGTGWLAWERLGPARGGESGGLVQVEAAPSGREQTGAAGLGTAGTDQATRSPEGARTLRVHVAGAVRNPGVYALAAGSRVVDAIAIAGGQRADGRGDALNLAAPLADGDKVYVPNAAEVAARAGAGELAEAGGAGGDPGPSGWAGTGGAAGRVDVNRADARTLEALPGVGPSLAAAIIGYRREHGGFRTLADLEKVPGIGPAKLAAMRDLVVFH